MLKATDNLKEQSPVFIDRGKIERDFLVKTTLCFIMVITVFISLIVSNQTKGLPFVFIPLIYVLGFVFALELYRYMNTPAMFVLNVLYLIRYFVLPLITFFDPRTFYVEEYNAGVWLMLYEEVVALIAIACFLPSFRKRKEKISKTVSGEGVFRFSKQLYLAAAVMCLLSMFFVIIDRSVLDLYNFIFTVSGENISEIEGVESSASTLSVIIIDVTRIIVPAAVALFFANRFSKKKNRLNYYLSIILGLVTAMLLIKGVDRGTVLLQGLAIVFFICYLMPEKKKKTLTVSTVLLFIVGAYLILIRMFEEGSSGGMPKIVDYVQSYVAGIKNQHAVVLARQYYNESVTIVTVFNDIFANVPFLSALADGENTCLRYFNLILGRTGNDQVMPLIGNGAMYFGIFFAPIFNILAIRFMLSCETAYLKSGNVMVAISFAYTASIIGFIHYQNIQLVMLYLTCRILPLFLVCWAFSLIKIKELE